MIPSMGWLNTIGVLQAWMSENQLQGYSESNIGWIISTYAFFLYIGGAQVGTYTISPHVCCYFENCFSDLLVLVGPIFDAHDVRFLVVPGSIGMVVAIMCLSVCRGMSAVSYTHHFHD